MNIRPRTTAGDPRVTHLLSASWDAETVVAHGTIYHATRLPSFIADPAEFAGVLLQVLV